MTDWESLEWESVVPEYPGVILLRLSGALTSGRESFALLDEVRDNLLGDYERIVFNMENVERMTSAGVGILCACFSAISDSKGRMYLVGVSDRNKTLLKVVGLWKRLAHFPGEADIRFD